MKAYGSERSDFGCSCCMDTRNTVERKRKMRKRERRKAKQEIKNAARTDDQGTD